MAGEEGAKRRVGQALDDSRKEVGKKGRRGVPREPFVPASEAVLFQ